MSQVLCITGMHRSGTSLTASWMERCGLAVHDGNVVGASKWNPYGHFEDKEILQLQGEAIGLRDGRSQRWKLYEPDFLRFGDAHLSRAQGLIATRAGKYGAWGWKDPRSVFFLPHWKQLIPDLRVLLLWRPCAEVANSLLKRSRESGKQKQKVSSLGAVRLWQSYNYLVLAYKQAHPHDTILVSIHDLVADDRALFEQINQMMAEVLTYQPISGLVDDSLMSSNSSGVLLNLIGRMRGITALEADLQARSDLRPEGAQSVSRPEGIKRITLGRHG